MTIDEIKSWIDNGLRMLEGTAPGPWEDDWYPHQVKSAVTGRIIAELRDENGDRNAAFIADARTRLPQALRMLQAAIEAVVFDPEMTDDYGMGWNDAMYGVRKAVERAATNGADREQTTQTR